LIGIDVGTTGCRSILFNSDGREICKAYREYSVRVPRPGWAEQEAQEWLKASISTLKEVVEKSRIQRRKITAICVTGQQPSPVFIDRNGKPLCSSILWMDRRAVSQCDFIKRTVGEEEIYNKTALRIDPIYAVWKIMWIKENSPEVYRRTFKVLQPKDFLVYKFTGEILTDYASASATQLVDIHKKVWSEDLLKIFDIPINKLPEIESPTKVVGPLLKEIAEQTDLVEGIPVVLGAGDSTVSGVGAGVVMPGQTCVNIGTSSDVLICTEAPFLDSKRQVTYYPHAVPNRYISIAGSNTSGMALRWFRDSFCILEKETAKRLKVEAYEIMNVEAQNSKPGANGLVFLPYLMGERSPIFDPAAKGLFFGITLRHNKADFIRAIMEGVAYSVQDRIKVAEDVGVKVSDIVITGGGAKSSLWRQIIADVTGKTTAFFSVEEATCLGAAILGGVGIGLYSSIEEMCDEILSIKEKEKHIPRVEYRNLYHSLFKTYKKLYQYTRGLGSNVDKVIQNAT